jgi:hypothetical protein
MCKAYRIRLARMKLDALIVCKMPLADEKKKEANADDDDDDDRGSGGGRLYREVNGRQGKMTF